MSDHHPANDLPVCPLCGWHKLLGHEDICWPEAGAAAQRLVDFCKQFDIEATKLGWRASSCGQHGLSISLANGLTVIFDVARSSTFLIRTVFANHFSETDAGKFAIVLKHFADSMELQS